MIHWQGLAVTLQPEQASPGIPEAADEEIPKSKSIMVLDEHLRKFVSEHLAYFCPSCFCSLNSFVKIFMFQDTAASCFNLTCDLCWERIEQKVQLCDSLIVIRTNVQKRNEGLDLQYFRSPKKTDVKINAGKSSYWSMRLSLPSDWISARSHLSMCKQTNDG